jgi:hypothetical protein
MDQTRSDILAKIKAASGKKSWLLRRLELDQPHPDASSWHSPDQNLQHRQDQM